MYQNHAAAATAKHNRTASTVTPAELLAELCVLVEHICACHVEFVVAVDVVAVDVVAVVVVAVVVVAVVVVTVVVVVAVVVVIVVVVAVIVVVMVVVVVTVAVEVVVHCLCSPLAS